jgi:hypothetical protein
LPAVWLEQPHLGGCRLDARSRTHHAAELRCLNVRSSQGGDGMSFLTHFAFSAMLLLALWAGFWSHQR